MRENKLVVINGTLNTVVATQPTGGAGAFGLAVNPVLNRAYVSHRGSGDIATMDGSHGWQSIESQRINACGADQHPLRAGLQCGQQPALRGVRHRR